MHKVSVVVPNWNGEQELPEAMDSLLRQSFVPKIIVVDNASTDNSLNLLETAHPEVEVLPLSRNKGFAGGVNVGIDRAIEQGANYVGLFNNDAVADEGWLRHLVGFMDRNPKAGIATSRILDRSGKHIDSTGECYTIWGLPYPRGRGEPNSTKYDKDTWVFGASGAASIYRVEMLEEIGLFDEDFFAYYEDVDISFRAQLAGWKVAYVPEAVVCHQIGASSAKVKDFAVYQTLKNLPLLLWKNVPGNLMLKIWPRLFLAYWAFAVKALWRGQFSAVFKGIFIGTLLWPKKLIERYKIQKNRKVSLVYIGSIVTHDMPPEADGLRKLRTFWWKLIRKEV